MNTPASAFFVSYSRENLSLQRRVITGLRERGVNVWVDVENLIPGSPAWEREIERAIRSAAGVIVLLSPEANNSEWVRREISFAEQNAKRIFPVLIQGDEDDSIPLRLSSHQRVDIRRNFDGGLDELANALKEHVGVTAVHRLPKQQTQAAGFDPALLRKFLLPGLIVLLGFFCVGGLMLAGRFLFKNFPRQTPVINTTPTNTDTVISLVTNTPADLVVPSEPRGKIVYTCQIQGDEICAINADGSGWKRLTNLPSGSSYANLAPDGKSVLFVTKASTSTAEIHEIDLNTGNIKQLTSLGASVGAPEISPDNQYILFTYRADSSRNAQLWIMNRDGSDPHKFYSTSGKDAHDAIWSPDGAQILFASGRGDSSKLYVLDFHGSDPRLINDTIDTRGRSDWSLDNWVVFDMGAPFQHDLYLMNIDGGDLHKLSNGNNSQGASFSPDGQWIAFTAYTDVANKNEASCEIYIMRVDGSDLRRLTSNDYCDYQPRWGN